ncbi:uncharacterized protein LOC130753684 [Actinidia eriantha]|uniref:uncharacterized protein LOC130753684 n=1 Tax=Actinidia eriantha TaxID=165200 RepID=UPI0025849096|nr:uncharacterized protein LOC130753684 [Actinidia eriantha]
MGETIPYKGPVVLRDLKKLKSEEVDMCAGYFSASACLYILPVKANLMPRKVLFVDPCVLCGDEAETVEHILRNCSFVEQRLHNMLVAIWRNFVMPSLRYLLPLPKFSVKWTAPMDGLNKINFDGAYFKTLNAVGIGIVVRNHRGEVTAALSEKLPFTVEVDCMEALPAAKAIQFAKDLGIFNVH